MKSSAVGGGDSIRPIPAATVISTPARKHWSSTNVVLNQFLVPDLILSPPLKEDDNNDLTFEETWATSDYWFQSNNSAPTQHWGGLYIAPKARVEGNKADGLASGWGYGQYLEGRSTDLNGASMDTTKTTVAVDGGTQPEIGQTALIGTLQMGVTGISGSNLTVTRAMNGSTAAAHADNADINILSWPASVERAALVQTARIWTRSADFEPCFVDSDIDTDVRILLEPYRKTAA